MGQKYAPATQAWGLCKRCGLRFLLRNLVFDGYMPELRVCTSCYDPRHPQEYPVNVTDPEALWKCTPDDAAWLSVITATVGSNQISLTWTPPDPSGRARYETYTLLRSFSPDGITYAAQETLGVFPLTYYGDNNDLANLVENGNPPEGNNGIKSQTLSYVDNDVNSVGYYQYALTAQDIYGDGPASFLTVPVSFVISVRVLEDDVSQRVLEDGATFRSLEY